MQNEIIESQKQTKTLTRVTLSLCLLCMLSFTGCSTTCPDWSRNTTLPRNKPVTGSGGGQNVPGINPFMNPSASDMRGVQTSSSNPAIDFLAPYGLENFSAHYIAALETFVLAKQDYESGQYLNAKSRLDALWTTYPIGNDVWWSLPPKLFGINIGTPPCYPGLRMLTDMTDWRVENPKQEPAPRTVRLTVLIVGHTSGIEPQNLEDLKQGNGILVTHDLDPRIESDGYAVVHESLWLFNEYVTTMTKGMLDVETYIQSLPDVDLPVHAYINSEGRYFAKLKNFRKINEYLSDEVVEATDWWWILYPSHVPEQHPDFENAEFVTGGMGLVSLDSPCFIIDDRWLVRKPPHLGEGEYSSLERGAYLPQWLQHEFFHHLYRTWPKFKLEVTDHQWHDDANWPTDFEGLFEADYYHESLYKRLHFAEPPLHSGLRSSLIDAPWEQLLMMRLLRGLTW